MTETTKKKIAESIAECNNIIAKEESRNASLRPQYMIQVLEHAYSHREKLQKMLADATN